MTGLAATRRGGERTVRVRVVVERVVRGGVDADVVVRELAHLRVVHAEDLGLLVAAHAAPGDVVHDPEDDRLRRRTSACGRFERKGRGTHRHDEGVAQAGHAVGDLVAELDVVVVEPATRDLGRAVEAGDARLREEAGEDVADDAADSMGG